MQTVSQLAKCPWIKESMNYECLVPLRAIRARAQIKQTESHAKHALRLASSDLVATESLQLDSKLQSETVKSLASGS